MILFSLLLFFLGLFVGSFLNVLIDRIPRGEGFIGGRSHCDLCGHTLAWFDLIPLVSFFLLRGKCRYCHKKIGYEYPIVEATTGIAFGLFFFLMPPLLLPFFILQLVLLALFLVIFFTDLWYGIIPDKILIGAGLLTVILQLATPQYIPAHIIAGLCAGLFFLALFLGTKGRGMGFGDVKLALFLGFFLGYPSIVVSLYIAFLTGALVALILVVWRKKKLRGDTIPFGPFLVLGGVIGWLWGKPLWELLLKYFFHLS